MSLTSLPHSPPQLMMRLAVTVPLTVWTSQRPSGSCAPDDAWVRRGGATVTAMCSGGSCLYLREALHRVVAEYLCPTTTSCGS